MPTLRLKLPQLGEITHELHAERITIGRRPDNTIQIVDPSVSAHHAELIIEDGHYRLHDLGSTNRSFVENEAVTDFHLHQPCKVVFGTIQCEFDPYGGADGPRLPAVQLDKDFAFLRGENADLLGKIGALQRQVDILSSARLITKKADTAPFAAHSDSLKTIASERDDLRHLTSGLKLELENLRAELAATAAERDAARQAAELVHAEKATTLRELQALRERTAAPVTDVPAPTPQASGLTSIEETAPPSRPAPVFARSGAPFTLPATPAESAATQRIILPLPKEFAAVAMALAPVQSALASLMLHSDDTNALAQVSTFANRLVASTAHLSDHPLSRLCLAIEGMLQDLATRPEPPAAPHIRTLTQATDLIASLLHPRHLHHTPKLPHPRILAVDDDIDLLETLAASLEMAHLATTGCADGKSAHAMVATRDFDLLLLDINLPDLDGPTLCGQIRENERYRKTPIIFLTAANTLERRAQASLAGGNDFLPKPFNAAELTVKAETWIWKSRYGLL